MSITIGDLKYQDTSSSLMKYARSNYSWLSEASFVSGVKGKATVNGIDITGTLLNAASCVASDIDTALATKEIELNYYNLSFPISHCDLKRTWLSAFADKYTNEEDVYIDALIPYLGEKVSDEIRLKFHSDIMTEATADVDVVKVTITGDITTPANTYSTLIEFIDGLPSNFLNDALDKYSREWYGIEVSVEVYKLLKTYLGDKVNSYGISIGGFYIEANKGLSGTQMIAKSFRNDLFIIDDSEDLSRVKVIRKEWENKSYIITGVAFKGSYLDSEKIVISN